MTETPVEIIERIELEMQNLERVLAEHNLIPPTDMIVALSIARSAGAKDERTLMWTGLKHILACKLNAFGWTLLTADQRLQLANAFDAGHRERE